MGGTFDDFIGFNAPKSYQLGWYSSKSVDSNINDPAGCWRGNVYGIADYENDAATTVILRIKMMFPLQV